MSALWLVSQIWQPKSARAPAATLAIRRGCEHPIAAGRLLIEAKGQIPHGQWLLWLKESIAKYQRLRSPQLAPDAQRIPRHWSCNHAHD